MICSYLGGDAKRVSQSIIVGSGVPLCMLFLWNMVSLGIPVPGTGDPLQSVMSQDPSGPSALIVRSFSLTALSTSCTGTVLALLEFLSPLVRQWFLEKDNESIQRIGGGKQNSRGVTLFAVLTPPLAVAAAAPDGLFQAATSFAGSYFVTALFGIFPPLMAIKMRKEAIKAGNEEEHEEMLPGGKPALFTLVSLASSVIVLQAMQDTDRLSETFFKFVTPLKD